MRGWVIGAGAALALAAAGGSAFWAWGARRLEAGIDARIAALEAAGVEIETQSRAVTGFPFAWRVEARGVSAGDAAGMWRVRAPLAVAQAGFAEGARVTLALPQDAVLSFDAAGGDVALAAEGLAFEPVGGDLARPRLVADRLTLTPLGPDAPVGALLSLGGARIAQSRAASGARAALIEAETLDLVVGPEGGARLDEVAMTAQADGLAAPSLAAFQAARGSATLDLLAARAVVSATQPRAVSAETGPARLALRFDAAGLTLSAGAEQVRPRPGASGGPAAGAADGATAGVRAGAAAAAPVGAVTIGAVEAGMTLPLRAGPESGPEPGRYALTLRLRDAVADPDFWAAFDPGGALPRAPAQLAAEIAGDADLRGGVDAENARHLKVRTVEIDAFSAEALGAKAEATGLLRIRPGEETPDGDVSLRVEGWRALLAALQAAGLVSADLSAFATLLAETYGLPGQPDGAFVSDIRLSEGAVYANGERLR